MKYAVVRDGVVENVIELGDPNPGYLPPPGTQIVPFDEAPPSPFASIPAPASPLE